MTKFFIPKQKGPSENHHADKDKKKKKGGNCNESLSIDITNFLKKVHTRQIQKTIRKIRESKEEEKEKHEKHLVELKSMTKSNLRRLSCHILTNELNVDEEAVKKIAEKVLKTEGVELNDIELSFYNLIQKRSMFKTEIQNFQRVRNKVNEKKHNKKEIAKLKKKKKMDMKKEEEDNSKEIGQRSQNDEISEEEEVKQLTVQKKKPAQIKVQKEGLPQKTKFIEKFKTQEGKQRTEFRKTGRNKVIQQKKDKRRGTFTQEKPEQTKVVHQTRFQRLNNGQELHPSWSAKRDLKNQMFIQPFQGKKIML